MTRPLAIDLCTGLHGWAEGLVAEGFRVIGFDLEDMCGQFNIARPEHVQLVIQDVLTLHGSQFKSAALIVASPPCQKFSYMAMPWTKAKQMAAEYRSGVRDVRQLTALFDACFRIQREACEAAGHHIPLIVENVRGAIPWVGRSRWNFGSFHLWGDVPALMPPIFRGAARLKTHTGEQWNVNRKNYTGTLGWDNGIKNLGGSWFNIGSPGQKVTGQNPDGRKTSGHPNIRDGHPHTKHLTNPDGHIKLGGSWFHGYRKGQGPRNHGSKSRARKAASAMIAKIPLPLSRHIARQFNQSRSPEALTPQTPTEPGAGAVLAPSIRRPTIDGIPREAGLVRLARPPALDEDGATVGPQVAGRHGATSDLPAAEHP